MPKQRHEISDADWELVADLSNTPRRTGRPRADDRLILDGVFWVLCSGTTWRDMPERYGPWSTVYQRFRDWRNQGTFNKMLKRSHGMLIRHLGINDHLLMVYRATLDWLEVPARTYST